MLTRRDVLAGLAAGLALPTVPRAGRGTERLHRLYAAARKSADGHCSFAIFSPVEGEITAVELPDRGHGIAVAPNGSQCVIFARRPGRFAVAVDRDGRVEPHWFAAAPQRHFYGHGTFSPDGRLLLSTENDYENGRGVLGVRDVGAGYRQIGELPSYGVGPHDVAYLSDRRTLVVANGALKTHPSTGRKVLNLATMRPSLVYIDSHTGDLLEEHVLPSAMHQLSIRHLAVGENDVVVFGGQHQGPLSERPPLIGFHRRGEQITLVEPPPPVQLALENYIGSVAADPSGTFVAASSPRGGLVTFWDVRNRTYVAQRRLADVCGLAPGAKAGGFLLTSGEGRIEMLAASDAAALLRANPQLEAFMWDNHAAAL